MGLLVVFQGSSDSCGHKCLAGGTENVQPCALCFLLSIRSDDTYEHQSRENQGHLLSMLPTSLPFLVRPPRCSPENTFLIFELLSQSLSWPTHCVVFGIFIHAYMNTTCAHFNVCNIKVLYRIAGKIRHTYTFIYCGMSLQILLVVMKVGNPLVFRINFKSLRLGKRISPPLASLDPLELSTDTSPIPRLYFGTLKKSSCVQLHTTFLSLVFHQCLTKSNLSYEMCLELLPFLENREYIEILNAVHF